MLWLGLGIILEEKPFLAILGNLHNIKEKDWSEKFGI